MGVDAVTVLRVKGALAGSEKGSHAPAGLYHFDHRAHNQRDRLLPGDRRCETLKFNVAGALIV